MLNTLVDISVWMESPQKIEQQEFCATSMTSKDSGTAHVREKTSIHQTKIYSVKLQNALFTL